MLQKSIGNKNILSDGLGMWRVWEKGVYRFLLGKPERIRQMGRPRRRRVYIRLDLQGVGCGYMDWIELTQDRQLADACECGNKLSGSVKCGEFLD